MNQKHLLCASLALVLGTAQAAEAQCRGGSGGTTGSAAASTLFRSASASAVPSDVIYSMAMQNALASAYNRQMMYAQASSYARANMLGAPSQGAGQNLADYASASDDFDPYADMTPKQRRAAIKAEKRRVAEERAAELAAAKAARQADAKAKALAKRLSQKSSQVAARSESEATSTVAR